VPENIQLDRDIVFATINGNVLKLDTIPRRRRGSFRPSYMSTGEVSRGEKNRRGNGFSASPHGAVISSGLEEIGKMEVNWFNEVFKMK
jgi:hypothetical protein